MYTYESKTPKYDFSYPLPAESISEMERHTKFDAGQERNHFNKISNNYDKVMKTVGYPDPELIAVTAKKIAAEKMIPRTEALVADFGCGTGMVGEALEKHGFKQIYGIDCSEGMLQIAE
jgi:predicted TPR repeat methyltransferase